MARTCRRCSRTFKNPDPQYVYCEECHKVVHREMEQSGYLEAIDDEDAELLDHREPDYDE